MTQRRFDVEPEPPAPEPSIPPPTPRTDVPEAPPPPTEPRGPSDTALRERQRRWLQERARFLAAQDEEARRPPG